MIEAPLPTAVDISGLEDLRHRAARDDPAALQEAAVQFEALFIGLMLKSARDASVGQGIFDGESTRQYLELMDQQVALELARKGGFGFGKMLVGELAPPSDARTPSAGTEAVSGRFPGIEANSPPATGEFPHQLPQSLLDLAAPARPPAEPDERDFGAAAIGSAESVVDGTPEAFVRRLLPQATEAARSLGIEPRLLLAQAALETGWGSATAALPDGQPANNLFGIKAGADWRGPRVAHWTVEHGEGGATRKREVFRAYPRTTESFADYVDLISSSPRYAAALEQAQDPEAYAHAVAAAGYATDPNYVEKWLSIYHGERLDGAMRDLKSTAFEPTQ